MKRSFLNSVCPYRVLEQRVTWGEFIGLTIQGFFGGLVLYSLYIFMVIAAEVVGAIS